MIQFIDLKYGYTDIGDVKLTSGKIYNYLGMKTDYSEKGKVKIDMRDYGKQMMNDLPIKLDKII